MAGNDVDSRLSKIEEKLKFNFIEIERRLIDLEAVKPTSLEDRIQHVEDLLMLMQIENEKIKQMLAMRHVVTPAVQANQNVTDLEERLQRLEENLPEDISENPIGEKVDELDKCLAEAIENFNKRLINLEEHISLEIKDTKNENSTQKIMKKEDKRGVLKELHGILQKA